jgi:hypothetical protein
MFNPATRLAKRLYYLLWLGPRGYGKPVPKDIWLSQYKRGDWDYCRSIDELARYMVIVGYIHRMSINAWSFLRSIRGSCNSEKCSTKLLIIGLFR